ncbi:MAG TPA: class I SAM-dependent methyltransferase [Coxiellaceae bacterium]|nr:class I SAM-dependent methyltransferase [Coxiellaceae bacterium]
MSKHTTFLTPELYDYFQRVSVHETDVQRELREYNATLSTNMPTGPEQAQFMGLLLQLMEAKKALEIGTFTGYGALAIALNLPEDGKLTCIDPAEQYTNMAKEYWEKANVAHKITVHSAKALPVLKKMVAAGETNTFDFIFIDADKPNYDPYYEAALQLIRPKGLIAIDNTLWGGEVLDQTTNPSTCAIQILNQKIHRDSRVWMSMIPIGDGLTLVIKK